MTLFDTTTDLTSARPRWLRGAVGAALVAAGVIGLSLSLAIPAAAQTDDVRRHEAMHRMMEAMHGHGAAERMHAEGGEEMMVECASMGSMGAMGSMMDRRGAR